MVLALEPLKHWFGLFETGSRLKAEKPARAHASGFRW
jgi:hypothetical protein